MERPGTAQDSKEEVGWGGTGSGGDAEALLSHSLHPQTLPLLLMPGVLSGTNAEIWETFLVCIHARAHMPRMTCATWSLR